jgi:predicted ATPase/DNA-binding CsgD family transcriptional regulator
MPSPTGQCEVCGVALLVRGGRSGRPARFCSNACRQRAYRRRTARDDPAPPVAAPLDPDGNLTPALERLIGREHELADLESRLRTARLVSLLGPGGAGKTRLAVEVGARVRPQYPGGVWLVELATLTSGALLAQHLAATLRVRERPGQAVLDTLAEILGGTRTLIVLDNCEHLVETSARLAESLLRRCPGLTVLATSRESLELPGEVSYRLGELTLPPGTGTTSRGALLASGAVRLFVERARAVVPDFQLTSENSADVAGVCARLDGNPLAIELAARRVRLLPVGEILDRLDDRFGLLTGGSRTATGRHRDLRAAIEWSFDLLDPAEQAAFRRLSVLAGGFTVDGAVAVCASGDLPAGAVLDLLASLEAKSLIVAEPGAGRFRQLESIRLYARERLAAAGEDRDCYDRLVGWLLRLAEPIVGDRLPRSFEEIAPLDAERDNLLHALEWTVQSADQRQVLLAAALGRCWRELGLVTEGLRLLHDALAVTDPAYPGRSAALAHAAWLATMQGDHAEARGLVEEALRLEDPVERPRPYVRVLSAVASGQSAQNDLAGAYASRLRCLELVRPLGQLLDTAVCEHNLAYVAVQLGRLTEARTRMDESLAMFRAHASEALPPEWLHTAGMLALGDGDLETAEARFREGLRVRSIRSEPGLPSAVGLVMIESLVVVAARRGDPVRALRLAAAVRALRRRQRSEPDPALRDQLGDAVKVARAAVGSAQARAAESAGERLDGDRAVGYALDDVWPGPGRPADGSPGLTRREQSVAMLVAEGLTNREIAGRLRIAERTVESHLEHIRSKLDLRSRAQVAGWAVQHAVTART